MAEPAPPPARPVAKGVGAVSTPLLTAAIVVVGGLDFALATRGTFATIACVLLGLLVAPWAILSLRRDPLETSDRRRALLRRAFHAGNIALVLAFTAAKAIVLADVLRGEPGLFGTYRTYAGAVVVLLLLGVAFRGGRVARLVAASADHPARLMGVSFGLTAVVGALLLALPASLRDVSQVSLLDAFFMSMSAVCVTGLTTVNVAETYTFTGQLVLCLLMQVGGLGIMVLTAAVTMLAGQRLAVKSTAVLAEMVDSGSMASLKRTIRAIAFYTLAFEAVGALLLYVQLRGTPGIELTASSPGAVAGAGSALWAAIFHSVSAFCNGSMSNFRGGMMPFASHVGVCQTVSALIVLGGLGFPVMHEILQRASLRLRGVRPRRASLNTRVALLANGTLLAGGAIAYFALERGASFRELSVVDQLSAALFQSACIRTSGFNVVDVAAMRPATLLLSCFAMFVGANPASTAGGIKTTTLAVLFAAYRGELRGQRPRLLDRTIPEAVVRRAVGVVFISTTLVCAVVLLLSLTERHDTLALFFETVSAFSTTGISTGITPSLTVAGKLLLALTMILGRIGPLTVALALSAGARRARYELPEERVMIG
jgi:trk system potassium uptake protein TrkH